MKQNIQKYLEKIKSSVRTGLDKAGQKMARLKKDGIFITSGIIDFKENEVKEAIERTGMKVLEITHQGEWVSITAQKMA